MDESTPPLRKVMREAGMKDVEEYIMRWQKTVCCHLFQEIFMENTKYTKQRLCITCVKDIYDPAIGLEKMSDQNDKATSSLEFDDFQIIFFDIMSYYVLFIVHTGIDGNYPLLITTATVVITITPFLGNFQGNFA